LKQDFQLALLAPDFPHFRPRIPLNHGTSKQLKMKNEKLKISEGVEKAPNSKLQPPEKLQT
jgi:hypothetical protein